MSDGREWYIFVLLVMSEICRSPLTLIGKCLSFHTIKIMHIYHNPFTITYRNLISASCLAVMTLTNCIIKLVIAYLNSCKSHAPPSITVQSGLTEGIQYNFVISNLHNIEISKS